MLYQPYQNSCYRNCSSFVLDSSLTSLWNSDSCLLTVSRFKIEAALAPWSTTWTKACFSIKDEVLIIIWDAFWSDMNIHSAQVWATCMIFLFHQHQHVLPYLHDMFIVWQCKGKIVDDIFGIRHPLILADESPCLAQAISVHCGCWQLIRKFHGLSSWWR